MKKSLTSGIARALHAFGLVDFFQDILAPPRCMGCLRENTWICRKCNLSKPAPVEACIVCKEFRPRGATCRGCQSATSLQGIVAAGPYGSPLLRRGVHWLKFKNVRPVAFPLAQMLIIPLLKIAPLPALQQSAVIIPIPLHKKRQYQRGFNQTLEIAGHLQSLTQIPLGEILKRPKKTLTQTKLPHFIREKNTNNAFTLNGKIPKNIRYAIILDDVATSGSTLSAAAKTIPAKNNREIWALTVARG